MKKYIIILLTFFTFSLFGQTNTFPTTGNVGIGTTSPNNTKFHIHSSSASGSNLILSANYQDKYRWRFNTVDRGYAIDMDLTVSDNNDTQETLFKLSR